MTLSILKIEKNGWMREECQREKGEKVGCKKEKIE